MLVHSFHGSLPAGEFLPKVPMTQWLCLFTWLIHSTPMRTIRRNVLPFGRVVPDQLARAVGSPATLAKDSHCWREIGLLSVQ
jgi:hypothetical protein